MTWSKYNVFLCPLLSSSLRQLYSALLLHGERVIYRRTWRLGTCHTRTLRRTPGSCRRVMGTICMEIKSYSACKNDILVNLSVELLNHWYIFVHSILNWFILERRKYITSCSGIKINKSSYDPTRCFHSTSSSSSPLHPFPSWACSNQNHQLQSALQVKTDRIISDLIHSKTIRNEDMVWIYKYTADMNVDADSEMWMCYL